MPDEQYWASRLRQEGFSEWVDEIQSWIRTFFTVRHHGDFTRWHAALMALPEMTDPEINLANPAVTINGKCLQADQLRTSLEALIPWRKGPFQFNDVFIDTEWRSDFKWNRVIPNIHSLKGRKILDIGCGNGYHCWRMLHEEPDLVLGIDPSMLFNIQFEAVKKYIQDPRVHMLPVGIEKMPSKMEWFDTVFSMGVLYHRKSPIDHLYQLKSLLRPGGELCLETLVISEEEGQVLVPKARYARMNNVWFLPTTQELEKWLDRCGFINIRTVDVTATTVQEQRSTHWMKFESLAQSLDPENFAFTIEGYPAPVRSITLAERPE